MPETHEQDLSGVSQTLLLTLYLRAMESQRPDALIKDDRAETLVQQIDYDFNRFRLLHLSEANKLVIILRSRELDRYTRDFLARHPDGVVVHIGCGFDTRFERVDNGQVEWYDLDLPVDEWGFFDCPDSRLDSIRWLRGIEAMFRTLRIYHFQLGEAAPLTGARGGRQIT